MGEERQYIQRALPHPVSPDGFGKSRPQEDALNGVPLNYPTALVISGGILCFVDMKSISANSKAAEGENWDGDGDSLFLQAGGNKVLLQCFLHAVPVQFSLLASAADMFSGHPADCIFVFRPCFGIRLLSLVLLVLFLHRKAGKYFSRLLIYVCFPLLLFILFTQWLFFFISDDEI